MPRGGLAIQGRYGGPGLPNGAESEPLDVAALDAAGRAGPPAVGRIRRSMAFRPVDPRQSVTRARGADPRALARARRLPPVASHSARAPRSGASTRARRPPTAGRARTTCCRGCFKDIYPRYRTMRGYRVPRKAGWDCHGLPVELEVERELGISSKAEIEAYGIAEFNQRCRESVFRYVDDWRRLTERIGFWIDLDDAYVTLEQLLHRVRLVVAAEDLGRRTPLPEPQGRAVLPALRDRAVVARGGVRGQYQGRRGPVRLREAADSRADAKRRDPGDAARGGRRAGRVDDHPVDPHLQRSGGGRARHRVRARAARRIRGGVRGGRFARRAGLRRGRRDPRDPSRQRARGNGLRAAVRLHHRLRPARPHRPRGRLRLHGRGHRPRAHGDRLRRGRFPPRRAVRDHAPESGAPERHLRRAHHRLRRAAT